MFEQVGNEVAERVRIVLRLGNAPKRVQAPCEVKDIDGLLERGRRVRFVEDAARGLDEGRVAACLAAWRERGVEFTTAAEAASSLSSA